MSDRSNRYKLMVRYMGYALTAAFLSFLTLMMCSGLDIPWLKAIAAIVSILLSLLCLIYLYLTQELFRKRSLWLSACAAAILGCTVISLILSFPSPNPLKQPNPFIADTTETTATEETFDSWYDSYFPGRLPLPESNTQFTEETPDYAEDLEMDIT